MKRLKNSAVVLVVVLLLITAFIRGPLMDSLVIATCLSWLLFVCLCLAKTGVIKIRHKVSALSNQSDGQQTAELIYENKKLRAAFCTQIEKSLSNQLSEYGEKITWRWLEKNPVDKIINNKICRIQISGIEDFNSAQIRLGTNGALIVDFCKFVSAESVKKKNNEDRVDSETTVNIETWFTKTGKELLAQITCELSDAGYQSFYITPDGNILVKSDGELIPADYELQIPIVKFAPLMSVLKSINLPAKVSGKNLMVEW